MRVSMAISLLTLVAAVGSQARIIHDTKIREQERRDHNFGSPIIQNFQGSSDCCFSYVPRRIRCSNFVDYFLTSGGCIQPGVIFVTRTGKRVCANPSDLRVQQCIEELRQNSQLWT
ncbi:C-C motif chemokine 6-like [Nannospalax galili]|uniref:C-C motif chemokine 6-like n=1 Tax=Nannospalax galili TaxID=1026970 RepID=UPI00081A0425|nr:C-C motif chemokine 6-like [Nannospalax galili]